MKEIKKERSERPIEISKFVDEYIEKGGLATADGESYLPSQMDGSELIETSLRIIRTVNEPTSKEKEDKERLMGNKLSAQLYCPNCKKEVSVVRNRNLFGSLAHWFFIILSSFTRSRTRMKSLGWQSRSHCSECGYDFPS
jgi:hypothetical protein